MTENTDALFEVEPPTRAEASPGAIERAAATSLQALRAAGTLDETHALKVELIVQGARALDVEFGRGKVTVAAMSLFSKVLDTADSLPTVQQAVNDKFEAMTRALADAD